MFYKLIERPPSTQNLNPPHSSPRDVVMTEKIIKSLNLKILARDMKFTDPRVPLQALLSTWLPLGRNLIAMAIDTLPSPLAITSDKVAHLICPRTLDFGHLPAQTQVLIYVLRDEDVIFL